MTRAENEMGNGTRSGVSCHANPLAQAGQPGGRDKGRRALDAQREKRALQSLLNLAEKLIVAAGDAMPADKYGFAPTDGEFKGVRTFGQQVKHLAATNHILAAAALGRAAASRCGGRGWA